MQFENFPLYILKFEVNALIIVGPVFFAKFWPVREFDLDIIMQGINKKKKYIQYAFFATTGTIVEENLNCRRGCKVKLRCVNKYAVVTIFITETQF